MIQNIVVEESAVETQEDVTRSRDVILKLEFLISPGFTQGGNQPGLLSKRLIADVGLNNLNILITPAKLTRGGNTLTCFLPLISKSSTLSGLVLDFLIVTFLIVTHF